LWYEVNDWPRIFRLRSEVGEFEFGTGTSRLGVKPGRDKGTGSKARGKETGGRARDRWIGSEAMDKLIVNQRRSERRHGLGRNR